ncbi:MAG: methyltransferase domain-containing protein [Desulfatirhabdiaceae bacterium]
MPSRNANSMLSRNAKAVFYQVAGPFMGINGLIYRYFRAPRTGDVKVHLGPGKMKYINAWVNVDANMFTGKCDLWADLRNPLPFHDETVDCFYSHHMIEHLPNIQAHFREVFRCLKPGGVYRLGGPNGDSAIKKFNENDTNWFTDYPEKRTSIGGKFENFIFCLGEHLTILTYSFLEELLTTNGFIEIRQCMPVRETGYPELFSPCLLKEHESDFSVPHTLIVEAVKPR